MAELFAAASPPAGTETLRLSIGEPQHATPGLITETLIEHLHGLSRYPATRGSLQLRSAIGDWLCQRFSLPADSLDPERNILPVNGTREALFAIAQCLIDRTRQPLVMMPNPFYQIYEGAALLAGAEAYFVSTTGASAYLPDFEAVPESVWQRCQLLYLCSPGNPTGRILDRCTFAALLNLADKYDFAIASDECYSEIYQDDDQRPEGLLGAAAAVGNTEYRRCLVFHSLSKRSNAPGLRSGFVAGDADLIEAFYRYRTYHGSAMPPATQDASARAWRDETHVIENRQRYREKFSAVADILSPVLDVQIPPAAFYLWQTTPLDDQAFALQLYQQQNVIVLPGSYLSRATPAGDPGRNHVRIALVAPLDECIDAAHRIRNFVQQL